MFRLIRSILIALFAVSLVVSIPVTASAATAPEGTSSTSNPTPSDSFSLKDPSKVQDANDGWAPLPEPGAPDAENPETGYIEVPGMGEQVQQYAPTWYSIYFVVLVVFLAVFGIGYAAAQLNRGHRTPAHSPKD